MKGARLSNLYLILTRFNDSFNKAPIVIKIKNIDKEIHLVITLSLTLKIIRYFKNHILQKYCFNFIPISNKQQLVHRFETKWNSRFDLIITDKSFTFYHHLLLTLKKIRYSKNHIPSPPKHCFNFILISDKQQLTHRFETEQNSRLDLIVTDKSFATHGTPHFEVQSARIRCRDAF